MDIQSAADYAKFEFRDTFAVTGTLEENLEGKSTLRQQIISEADAANEVYHAAWLGLRIVLKNYYGMFLSRKLVTDTLLERCGAFVKQEIKRTHTEPAHRDYLANSKDLWSILTDVFDLGTRVLQIQSFPNAPSYDEHGCSFSNFMASNHPYLIKDIERLNDLLTLSRNMLVTRKATQEAAASAKFDQQVLQVIDACIRVTARGYDGEQNSATESKWANIIAAYKKLTITALQWLYAFVLHNERRKFHLFHQLFGNFHVPDFEYTREQVNLDEVAEKAEEQLPRLLKSFDPNVFQEAPALKVMDEVVSGVRGYCQQTMRPTPDYPRDFPARQYGKFLLDVMDSLKDRSAGGLGGPNGPDFADLPTAYFERIRGEDIPIEAVEVAGPEQAAQEILEAKEKVLSEFLYQIAETDRLGSFDARSATERQAQQQSAEDARHSAAIVQGAHMRSASEGHMLKLEEEEEEEEGEEIEDEYDHEEGEEDEEDEEIDEEESDDDADGTSRGLLTDIPLVLGPNEIDALPLMIQSSIRSTPDPKDTPDSVHVMQALRCYRMINESAGRNLLRELLIFIAAWDLQEHELYFRLMMNIMETILSYGLMPFAFDSFSEDKDVVSPAQSILIKLLTQMFRRRQSDRIPETLERKPHYQFPAPPEVETTIVRYIFTVFRTHIIPQTCALIYLQGQIRLGKVLPEDFPLNLWDMERVYEGVYQFLEFFAVLTESEKWKALLVKEEIVFELITLLRELDISIPKSSEIHAPQSITGEEYAAARAQIAEREQQSNVPLSESDPGPTSSSAAAKSGAQTDPSQRDGSVIAPVAVERPYDPSPPLSAGETGAFPSPGGGGGEVGGSGGDGGQAPPSETASALMENNIEPADFEWRNLKKLVVLVLSSLVWRSPTVQEQIRAHGGVEMILNCCNADGNNPYIKDHAVMCLRFLLEGSKENQQIVRELEERRNAERGGGAGPATTGQGQQRKTRPVAKVKKEEAENSVVEGVSNLEINDRN